MAGLFTFTALLTENGNGMVAIGGAGWRHRDHFHLEWSVHVSLAKYSIELFKFGLDFIFSETHLIKQALRGTREAAMDW